MDAFDRLAAEPKLDGPVHQHYLSRSYLNRFAENRRIFMYDRTDGSISKPLTPKKAAAIEHFYTFIDDKGRQRFELEALFEIVESRAGAALKAIVSGMPIGGEDCENLAWFIAMHAIRTPAALAEARGAREQAERFRLKLMVPNEGAAYRLAKESHPAGTSEAELRDFARRMFEMVDGDHFRINVPDEAARATSLKTWATVAEAIYKRDWTVMHAPDGAEFITSDSPVVVLAEKGAEDLPTTYGSPHARVFFPLSHTAMLGMGGSGARIKHTICSARQVPVFNALVAAECHRFVIASSADLLSKTIEPLGLTGTRWMSRVEVGVGIPPGEAQPAIFIKGLGRRPAPTA